jgi:hypothetical protein
MLSDGPAWVLQTKAFLSKLAARISALDKIADLSVARIVFQHLTA